MGAYQERYFPNNMKFFIDEDKLKHLIMNKKSYFEISYSESIGLIIAGFSLLFSIYCSDEYKEIAGVSGSSIKIFMGLISISVILYGIWLLYKKKTNKYTCSQFLDDISRLSEINDNTYSIISVHDNTTNRYLLYYDKDWDCKLFLNYKNRNRDLTQEMKNIKTLLSQNLQISSKNIKISYKFTENSEKISIGNNTNKMYEFHFYYAILKDIPTDSNFFKISGVEYFWMTLEEMQQDANMMKKNRDVISHIKNSLVPKL